MPSCPTSCRHCWPNTAPVTPDDLTTHDATRYRLDGGPLLPWALHKNGRSVRVEPINVLILSVGALDTGLRYARAGLGIIQTFRNWLDADFAAQNLLPVLPEWWPEMEGPYLYYPSRFAPAPLRAFIKVCRTATGKR